MKEEMKNQSIKNFSLFLKQCYRMVRTKNGRIMLLPKCEVCDSKKSKFIKRQETSGLLSSLGIKAPLSKIPLVGLLLFQEY